MSDKIEKKALHVKKSDKTQLLDKIDEELSAGKNLDFRFLVIVYLCMVVGLLLILPKIYIKNEIYYTSRQISKISSEYSILKEENRFLKQKVEYIKFKNQVLDTVF
jgi:cell division protein FtsL